MWKKTKQFCMFLHLLLLFLIYDSPYIFVVLLQKNICFFVHVFCAIFHLPKIEISVCLLSCSIVTTVCPIWIGTILNRYCRYFFIYRLQHVIVKQWWKSPPKNTEKKLYHPHIMYLSRIVPIHIIHPVVECCFYVFCVQRDIFYECIEIKYSKITYIFVI